MDIKEYDMAPRVGQNEGLKVQVGRLRGVGGGWKERDKVDM
jgi:hypothetical protein